MQTCSLRRKAASTLSSHCQCLRIPHAWTLNSTRSVSNSPYGRTHVWKRRPPVLPNPIVPKYPQTVIRSDGTSFVQWTTSPKSLIRLTRDTANNPVWNSSAWASERGLEEEDGSAGRMGRFSRKFGGISMPTSEQPSSVGKAADNKSVEELSKSDSEGVIHEISMGAGSVGMGGALDDVKWFEEMAELTGGAATVPGKGKKKEKKK